MTVWLYRRRLSLLSGAGQLVQMQAEALERAGEKPRLAAERRRLKYALHTSRRVSSLTLERASGVAARKESLFVDHSARVANADIVFVHNLAAAVARYIPGIGLETDADEEAAFFARLATKSRIIANSKLVRSAIIELFGIEGTRIDVLYPGFRQARFTPAVRDHYRGRARHQLGLDQNCPLIGFISSGNFLKRGIDHLVAAAERIHADMSNARFLVVGSNELPVSVQQHRLFREGVLMYRPKSKAPQRWYAALDLFLYPADWEEFGMVVIEAQAMGLPVLTSRRVGAAECLADEYSPWLVDVPDAGLFADAALRLLANHEDREMLVAAGIEAAGARSGDAYGDAAAALILAQKR